MKFEEYRVLSHSSYYKIKEVYTENKPESSRKPVGYLHGLKTRLLKGISPG
jgi:hypothetical protein